MNITEKIKNIIEEKKSSIKARLFVTREDGITVYDSTQDRTSTSVAALVSGVWQASEALMQIVHKNKDIMEFRFGFDTSEQGIYLFPIMIQGKRYLLGAIFSNCLNPGQLKRQVGQLKEVIDVALHVEEEKVEYASTRRQGFLFQDITDEEMDRLFGLGGI